MSERPLPSAHDKLSNCRVWLTHLPDPEPFDTSSSLPTSAHPLYRNGLCFWFSCSRSCDTSATFFRHLLEAHNSVHRAAIHIKAQQRVVVEETERLKAMRWHYEKLHRQQARSPHRSPPAQIDSKSLHDSAQPKRSSPPPSQTSPSHGATLISHRSTPVCQFATSRLTSRHSEMEKVGSERFAHSEAAVRNSKHFPADSHNVTTSGTEPKLRENLESGAHLTENAIAVSGTATEIKQPGAGVSFADNIGGTSSRVEDAIRQLQALMMPTTVSAREKSSDRDVSCGSSKDWRNSSTDSEPTALPVQDKPESPQDSPVVIAKKPISRLCLRSPLQTLQLSSSTAAKHKLSATISNSELVEAVGRNCRLRSWPSPAQTNFDHLATESGHTGNESVTRKRRTSIKLSTKSKLTATRTRSDQIERAACSLSSLKKNRKMVKEGSKAPCETFAESSVDYSSASNLSGADSASSGSGSDYVPSDCSRPPSPPFSKPKLTKKKRQQLHAAAKRRKRNTAKYFKITDDLISNREFYRRSPDPPPYPVRVLIRQSIVESENKRLTTAQIQKWIRDNFKYYRHSKFRKWGGVQKMVNKEKCFVKEMAPGDRVITLWSVDEKLFKEKKFRPLSLQLNQMARHRLSLGVEASSSIPPPSKTLPAPEATPCLDEKIDLIKNPEKLAELRRKAAEEVANDLEENRERYETEDVRPSFPFRCLIKYAIDASPQKGLNVAEITDWMLRHYLHYRNKGQAAVRAYVKGVLGPDKAFLKSEVRGGPWRVSDELFFTSHQFSVFNSLKRSRKGLSASAKCKKKKAVENGGVVDSGDEKDVKKT